MFKNINSSGGDAPSKFIVLQKVIKGKRTYSARDIALATEEVIANTVPVILTDEEQSQRFAKKVMDGPQTVREWFKNLIMELRKLLDKAYDVLKGQKSWEQMEILRNQKLYIDMIAETYFEGMRNDHTGKTSEQPKAEKFSLRSTKNMTWDEQMDAYFSEGHGKLKSSDTLSLGYSGDTYAGFGMKNSLIGITQGDINKVMRDKKGSRSAHGLDEKIIRMLDKNINNPVALIDNASRNVVYAFTGDTDIADNPVVAVINKNNKIDYFPAHIILSIYGMEDAIRYMRDHVPNGSRIEVRNKEKLAELLLGRGVQFSKLGTILGEFLNVKISSLSAPVNQSAQKEVQDSSGNKPSFSHRVTPEQDAAYMDTVESGDTETAQHMVDEAAKEAGYTYVRRSRKRLDGANDVPWMMFVEREKEDSIDGYGQYKYYATAKEAIDIGSVSDEIQQMAERYYGAKLNDTDGINPVDIVMSAGIWDDADFVQYMWDNFFSGMYDRTGNVPAIKTNDGLIIYGGDNPQIKSADAVTYDDNGNLIPLSKRFEKRSNDIRFSIRDYVMSIQSIGRKSVNAFTPEDVKKAEPFARQYWKEMGVKSPFFRAWFGDWRANDNTSVSVASKKGADRGNRTNIDTGWSVQVSGKVFAESQHMGNKNKSAIPYLDYINDIVQKAILLDSYGIGTPKSQNSLLMHSLYAVADIGDGPSLIKLYVDEMNNPNSSDTAKRAYQLPNIEKVPVTNGGVQAKGFSSLANATGTSRSVSDLFYAVKQHDKYFEPNPVQPALLNKDGTPKVFYHGTLAKGITEFSKDFIGSRFAADDIGFFFTDKESIAKDYASSEFDANKKGEVLAAYLSIKNPFVFNGKYAVKNGYGNVFRENDSINVWDDFQGAILDEAASRNADGIIVDDGISIMVVAFDSTQIKSATDNIGTFDGINPDIRFSSKDAPTVTAAQTKAALKENEQLKKALELAKQELTLSSGHQVRQSDIEKHAKRLLKDYKSSYSQDVLVNDLRTMYDYIANADTPVWDEVRDYGVNMARAVHPRACGADISPAYPFANICPICYNLSTTTKGI